MIETYRGVVYPYQLDHMNHMNVQWYVSKFDEATWHLFSSVGITSEYIRENNMGMAALEQHIKYYSELSGGDLLYIKSCITAVGNKTLDFIHIMYDSQSDKKVSETEITAVHIDRKLRKSCPLPGHIKEKCEKVRDNYLKDM